jgi:hypothetical protein
MEATKRRIPETLAVRLGSERFRLRRLVEVAAIMVIMVLSSACANNMLNLT